MRRNQDKFSKLVERRIIRSIENTGQILEATNLPSGGAVGQVLTKTGTADYVATWQNPTGGSGGGTGNNYFPGGW
jgi:hypothetical protein